MKAVQVSKPGGNFEVVERPIPQPARGQVRIKVEACGLCHSDSLVKVRILAGDSVSARSGA
jgi:D-arabinose 1-dehydrogenase-like Zn-dependent alcohol dehydrogenase